MTVSVLTTDRHYNPMSIYTVPVLSHLAHFASTMSSDCPMMLHVPEFPLFNCFLVFSFFFSRLTSLQRAPAEWNRWRQNKDSALNSSSLKLVLCVKVQVPIRGRSVLLGADSVYESSYTEQIRMYWGITFYTPPPTWACFLWLYHRSQQIGLQKAELQMEIPLHPPLFSFWNFIIFKVNTILLCGYSTQWLCIIHSNAWVSPPLATVNNTAVDTVYGVCSVACFQFSGV